MKETRFGQIGCLKEHKIEEYERLHSAVWPEVMEMITACNLRNYSIFRYGCQVFSYFEYVGEDYERDMEKMAQDPATQRWWTYTHPCFETYVLDPDNEYTCDMKELFHM